MFRRLRSALAGHYSYTDLVSFVEAVIANPPWPPDWRSAVDSVQGLLPDGQAFDDAWREKSILPSIRQISEQPTKKLQYLALIDKILDIEETMAIGRCIRDYTNEQAADILFEWPDDARAGQTIEWKRAWLAVRSLDDVLSGTVLFLLAEYAFDADAALLKPTVGLFGEAKAYFTGMRFRLRTLHWHPGSEMTADDSVACERQAEPMFQEMERQIAAIRREIRNADFVSGAVPLERIEALMQNMEHAARTEYRRITGRAPPLDESAG
jgi:hypothetical protein